MPKPATLTVTTGVQSMASWRSAFRALASAAACAAAGVREIEACRAASRAAASTDPCAMDVRPAAITRPNRNSTTGARITSSKAALPRSRAGKPDLISSSSSRRRELLDWCPGDLLDLDDNARYQGRHLSDHRDLDGGLAAARRRCGGGEQVAGG